MNKFSSCFTLLLLTIALTRVAHAQPEIQWQKTIGGSAADQLTVQQQTKDGGYILGGYSGSGISGDKTDVCYGVQDYWIIKTNASGTIKWQNTIGGDRKDRVTLVKQTNDGGYFVGGYSESGISGKKTAGSYGGADYWVIKLDSLGVILWQRNMGGTENDYLYGGDITTDGGYILCGGSNSGISGNKTESSEGGLDFWVMRLDNQGNIQWQTTIGGSNDDVGYSAHQTSDHGFIVAGYSGSNISGDKTEDSRGGNDYWILKLDQNGNIDWQKTIGGNDDDVAGDAIATVDGGYILGGSSISSTSGEKYEEIRGGYDYWIVKLDNTGALDWQHTIGGSLDDIWSSFQQTADEGYILNGSSLSDATHEKKDNSRGGYDIWVVKLFPDGERDWQETIGGSGDDFGNSIQQTTDEGFMIASASRSSISGEKSDNSVGGYDYWLVKLQCDEPPAATAIAPGLTTVCKPATVTLNAYPASGGHTYQWRKGNNFLSGETNSTFIATKSGHYNCVIKNACDSGISNSIIVTVYPQATATITPLGNLDICATGSVTLQANSGVNYTYQWLKGGSALGGATNQNFTAIKVGSYKVVVTNDNGCSKTSAATQVTKSCRQQLFAEVNTALSIFPNPTDGKFSITLSTEEATEQHATITVISAIGQEVFSEEVFFTNGLVQKEIELPSASPAGIYFVTVKNGNELFGEKLIIQ